MGYQDRDWYREHHANQAVGNRPRPANSFPAQIALGVAAGILVAAVAIAAVFEWRARSAAAEAQRVLDQYSKDQQLQQALAAKAVEDANARREAVMKARRDALAARQKAIEDFKRDSFEAQNRKEKAWERFYVKPPRCDEAHGGSWTVECANEFIRSKRTFEERFVAGKL